MLELSSYQLELIASARFDVAVLLNITPDHLDRHGDMDGYVAAKARIFRAQTHGDCAVIGVDDEPSRAFAARSRAPGSVASCRSPASAPVAGGVYAHDGRAARRSAGKPSDRSGRRRRACPASTTGRTPPPPTPPARALGLAVDEIVAGHRDLSRPRRTARS